MSDQVGNPADRFSRYEAQISQVNFPICINMTSPFLNLGVLGGTCNIIFIKALIVNTITKALLTPTPRPVGDLFATDFFATDWRSMRLVQPLDVHIRIEIIIAD